MNRLREGMAWLGLPGLMAVLLLVAVAWVEWQWLPALRAEAAHEADEAMSLRRRLQMQAAVRPSATPGRSASALAAERTPHGDEQAWRELWQTLPARSARVSLQDGVLSAAALEGLQVDTVQFRGERVPLSASEADLWRQRMALSVQGPYVAVRRWVARLQQTPAAGIDSLVIERRDLGSDQVSAQVGLSLWWRQAGSP